MAKTSSFTEAQIKRAMKAARDVDPRAVIEVNRDGCIRILPAEISADIDAPTENDTMPRPKPW